MELTGAGVGCVGAVEALDGWTRFGWRENMAVKSVSVAASESDGLGRFSSGAVELGEMDRIVRLAVRLAVGRGLDTELALLPVSGYGLFADPLRTSSRHWQRDPRVQFPQPTGILAMASSAHAQRPSLSHEPQLVGACSISSGGLMICEMENEFVVEGLWGWAVAAGVDLAVRPDVLALPS